MFTVGASMHAGGSYSGSKDFPMGSRDGDASGVGFRRKWCGAVALKVERV